jgi:hypothetical protein
VGPLRSIKRGRFYVAKSGGKERILLIGVDCGHMRYLEQEIYDQQFQNTKQWVSVNTGMAIVIGAWKLDELLNINELKTNPRR